MPFYIGYIPKLNNDSESLARPINYTKDSVLVQLSPQYQSGWEILWEVIRKSDQTQGNWVIKKHTFTQLGWSS